MGVVGALVVGMTMVLAGTVIFMNYFMRKQFRKIRDHIKTEIDLLDDLEFDFDDDYSYDEYEVYVYKTR